MADWKPRALLFDLLSALIDSWTLWDDLAGDPELGRRWRLRYLELTYGAGRYRPYLDLVRRAAVDVGLEVDVAGLMEDRWEELRPWPEAGPVLRSLGETYPLGVVTNCSEQLGVQAANLVGVPFRSVVTAEQVGAYKPEPRIYVAGYEALGFGPEDVLFVAGSPSDVPGANRAGMRVVWHNRIGLENPQAQAQADHVLETLDGLPKLL